MKNALTAAIDACAQDIQLPRWLGLEEVAARRDIAARRITADELLTDLCRRVGDGDATAAQAARRLAALATIIVTDEESMHGKPAVVVPIRTRRPRGRVWAPAALEDGTAG